MNIGKAVLGTLAAIAAGAIAGILLAPEKGSVTRKQIKDKSDEYMDELKSKFDEYSDQVSRKVESTKKNAKFLATEGKSKYDDFKEDVKNAASDIKKS